MNFIDTLKSVGGVKPCPECYGNDKTPSPESLAACHACHGTGTVLDLAPLLAWPNGLTGLVSQLRLRLYELWIASGNNDPIGHVEPWLTNLHTVGPQRAGNLVFKIAELLGGTAVVAEELCEPDEKHEDSHYHLVCKPCGYRLSTLIPDGATVLFVTDKLDEKEMVSVINTAAPDIVGFRVNGGKVLPYVLGLVSSVTEMLIPSNANFVAGGMKVISLYQEK